MCDHAQNRVYVANEFGSSISVIKDELTGTKESGARKAYLDQQFIPTVISGILLVPALADERRANYALFGITGRKAMKLKAGANDVRALPHGVYFMRAHSSRGTRVTKIVIEG